MSARMDRANRRLKRLTDELDDLEQRIVDEDDRERRATLRRSAVRMREEIEDTREDIEEIRASEVDETPPVDEPATPPGDEPPADEPPAETPPGDEPPADEPPPPADETPPVNEHWSRKKLFSGQR